MHTILDSRTRFFVALFLAGLALLSAALRLACAQDAGGNFIPNPGFEDGEKGWLLVTEKGEKGGRIIAEPGGNHALSAEGDTYWVAGTDRRVFQPIPRERFAGKQLRLTFRAKGDRDAYPGVIVTWSNAGKTEYITLCWKTKYVEHLVFLDEQYKTYERVRDIPPSVTSILGLTLYNCTRRGKIVFDDISLSLVEPAPVAVAQETISFKEWEPVKLTDRELIELSNTCNSLVAEWGCLYGLLLELERALYYPGGDVSRAESLRKDVMQLREKLLALQAFYTDRFQKTFGKTFTIENPHNFYLHNDKAGRDLMMSVGPAKSTKPPFVEVERAFASVRSRAEDMLKALAKEAKAAPAPDMIRFPAPDDGLFGERFFPKHVLIGLRATQYVWHAFQWLNADFIQVSNLVTWDFDEQERMKPNPDFFAAEVKHYDLRWELMSWMDPRVAIIQQRPSFRAALEKDPELYDATERGPAFPPENDKRWYCVNIHHPYVRQYAEKFYAELGGLFKDDKRVAVSEILAEPAPFKAVDGINYTFGYSKAAKGLFRAGLKEKFKTIEDLNKSLGSAYASFDSIEPPNYETMKEMAQANLPLIYEYRKFRKLAYADHGKRIHDAYQRGDAGAHPVANRLARMYLNGSNADPFDALRLASGSTDIFCTHNCAEGRPLDRAELVYYHSLAERLNKPRGSFEYYPFGPDHNRFRPGSGYGLFLVQRGVNNFWHALAWDVTTICAWIQNSIGDRKGLGVGVWSPTRESGLTLLHDSAGAIALVKKQLREGLEAVILNTKVVKPSIAMLAPYDASLVCWPDAQAPAEGEVIHRFLEERNYDYTYVPEELILSGEENLANVRVLFAPYVLWASRPLQERLLDWVSKGGVLISVGPLGYWDEYGRPSRVLMDKAFGDIPIEMRREALYTASFPYDALAGRKSVTVETVVPSMKGKQPNLIRADCGLGKVYITADPTMDALLAESKEALRRAMDEAAGLRTAWSVNGMFDLTTREKKDGTDRYLIVINRSVEKACEDTVVVKGEYPNPQDVCVVGGFPIPAKASAGATAFKTRLGPGEGTCIRLGPYRPVAASRAQVDTFLKAEAAGAGNHVQALLLRITTKTDRVSYAKAIVCRNAALALLAEGKTDVASELAEKAVKSAESKTPAAEDASTFSNPRAQAAPTIDGDASDWEAAQWTPMDIGRFKTMWDENALYFLVEVKDPEVRNDSRPPRLWAGDSVEIYLDVLGQGGNRKLGALDFQYCVSPDGLVQVEGRPTCARAAGNRTADGYCIEVVIPNDETFLVPVNGYSLAFNIRRLDYGVREGRFKFLADRALKTTGYTLSDNTLEWPKLKLVEAENDKSASALVLGDGKLPEIHIEKGSRIHLTGDPVIEDVDVLEVLKSCKLTSETRNRLTLTKRVRFKLADNKGRPVRDTTIGLKVTASGGSDAVVEKRERPDANGVISIELPAVVFDVELEKATLSEKKYDVFVDDIAVTAGYALKDVNPLAQSEYEVNCYINR